MSSSPPADDASLVVAVAAEEVVVSASAVDGDGGGQGGEGGVAVSKHAAKQKARHAKRLARHAQKMRTQEEMKLRQREEERMEAVEYCRANLQQDCGRTDDPLAPPPNPERALLLLQYSGTNYKGVQIQNRSRIATIEGDLLHALYRAGGISSDPSLTLSSLRWMRTARTDLGVHAALNVLSCVLLVDPSLADRVNALLPTAIRVIGIVPICLVPEDATSGGMLPGDACDFHAKNSCTGRSYEYLMPSAVWGLHKHDDAAGELEATPATTVSSSADDASSPAAVGEVEDPTVLFDAIPTRVLHRLLSASNKAVTSFLRSPATNPTATFLRPIDDSDATAADAAYRVVRVRALRRVRDELPRVLRCLREIRRKLHGLTHGLGPFRENLDAESRDLADLTRRAEEEIETEEKAMSDAGFKVDAETTLAAIDATAAAAVDADAVATASPFTAAASPLASFLVDLVSASSAPSDSNVFFGRREFERTRLTADQVSRVNTVLQRFIGRARDYHNFTKQLERGARGSASQQQQQQAKRQRIEPTPSPDVEVESPDADPSDETPTPEQRYSLRTVYDCRITELCMRDGVEYCRVLIAGQSFMLNQIRKMMALAVMCVRGVVDETIFDTVFDPSYDCDIQAAPARSLLLCGASFDRYERMCAAVPDGVKLYSLKHAFDHHRPVIDAFKSDVLESEVCNAVGSHAAFRMWLSSLEPPKLTNRPREATTDATATAAQTASTSTSAMEQS